MKDERDIVNDFFYNLQLALQAKGTFILEEVAEVLKLDLDRAVTAWSEIDYHLEEKEREANVPKPELGAQREAV